MQEGNESSLSFHGSASQPVREPFISVSQLGMDSLQWSAVSSIEPSFHNWNKPTLFFNIC
jgi:hypothetical protein